MKTTTLLVGCGKVGTRLGRRLIAHGGAVIAVRRDPSSLPPSFIRVAADLAQPPMRELPPVDRLVITLPPPVTAGGYETLLRNLGAAMPVAPERAVFVSSTRVFEGWGPGHLITEDTRPHPLSDRAGMLLAGEDLARELFDAITLRPAGIYGPGRGRLIASVRDGRAVDRLRLTNRIHEVDLVRTIEKLLLSADPPSLLHGVDGLCAEQGDVVDHIAARLGVASPPGTRSELPSGRHLDGTRLKHYLGSLEYPNYSSGYDAMLQATER